MNIKKEISFIEAVKYFKNGTNVECELEDKSIYYDSINDEDFKDENGNGLTIKEILEGKWYIDIKGDNNMDNIKTFREVVRDIKEGECYTDGLTNITMKHDQITIKTKNGKANTSFAYSENYRNFKLKRKEYSFNEAFKFYEEGEEIESLVTGYKYKYIKNIDCFYNDFAREWIESCGFGTNEVRGKWYINN